MLRNQPGIVTIIVVALITASEGSQTRAAEQPNIIIIMGDDMGYSDLGCYGGEIQTPTLDRLAAGGIRFTQFYNTARCCPTRASLLSGLYPHQAGVGHMMNDRGYDGYRGELNRRCMTIAEVLRTGGYTTFLSGKWHITKATAPTGPKDNWPLQRGFDRFYGTIHGAGSFYDPNSLTRQNTQISPYADKDYQPKKYYYTDAISDNAVTFIDRHFQAGKDKPFFLYAAYTAAHWPMHALEKDIRKYRGKYDNGYAPIRKARLQRMRKMGLLDPAWEMSPQAGDWNSVSNKPWESRCMEVYAAMVDSMDQGIGRIVSSLEKHGQLDNTLILFLQDNGGCAEALGRRSAKHKTRPEKPLFPAMARDELQRDMIPKQTRDGYPTIQGTGAMPGPDGTYIAYGKGWANVSNTPFREYKHWVHEGGISTPLIAHWPKGIKRRNALEHQAGHLIDLMATCVNVSGTKYPATFRGRKIKPMEGRSLAPAFAGKKIEREAIYWEHEGNRAIRVGDWKLVARGAKGKWELYNVKKDRTELRDLAASHEKKAAELADMWTAYAKRADVLPLNPRRPQRQSDFSKKRRFVLKPAANLPRRRAPYVVDCGLEIGLEFDKPSGDGVLVAQGGSSHGWALYVKDGRLTFAVRRGGKFGQVRAASTLAESGAIKCQVSNTGQVVLSVDDKVVARGATTWPLKQMPQDGLQVGADLNGAVGRYQAPNRFQGKISNLILTIQR